MQNILLVMILALSAIFQLNAQSLTLSSPNGGQTLYTGQSASITWTSSGISSFVKLEFSADSGATWTLIADGVNNSGSYSWTIPNQESEKCLARIRDFNNPAIGDTSNAVFTMKRPFISLTSPNGGEVFEGCQQVPITWTSGGTLHYAKLYYSIDGGSHWIQITTTYERNATSHLYNWNVPSVSSETFKVRIVESSGDNSGPTSDESDTAFSVTRTADFLTLTSPNGGESWSASSLHPVTWDPGSTTGNITARYSTDLGATWSYIRNDLGREVRDIANTGSSNWLLPSEVASANALVQVYETSRTCNMDLSDNRFTIDNNNTVITVGSPFGGERWYVGRPHRIVWSASNLPTNYVTIEYSTDNSQSWTEIVASASNNGAYSWTIPDTPSSECLVRVKARDNYAIEDVSDQVFTIAEPFINITSPAGGEVLSGCGTHQITWEHEDLKNSVTLYYSLDGGVNWIYDRSVLVGSSTSLDWTVPAVQAQEVRIMLEDSYNSKVRDTSEAFTIAPGENLLTLTSPVGGETWADSSLQTISWNTTGTVGNISIRYSTNGGASWNLVKNSSNTEALNIANTGSFDWQLPANIVSSNCMIRLNQYYSPYCVVEYNDQPFTINNFPVITVAFPSGGDTVYAGRGYNIMWSGWNLPTEYVRIEYSSDNGASWNEVIASTNNDGRHLWTVPYTISQECLIRVTAGDDASIAATSAAFTIAEPYIKITSPATGDVLTGCGVHQITWEHVGLQSNSVRLYYSIDGGNNWIYHAQTSDNYYSWNVPAVESQNVRIKIEDYYKRVKDSSEIFTIDPGANFLTLTSPVGGEIWPATSSQTITWNTTGTVGNVSLKYSADGGVTWNWCRNNSNSIANNIANTGSFQWLLPANTGSFNCMISLYQYSPSCIVEYNDHPFTIDNIPVINVASPANGEKLYAGRNYTISWLGSGLPTNYVKIEFSSDSGLTWTEVIASTVNDGSHSWTASNTVSDDCLIRIKARDDESITGTGTAFTIAQPYINITSPNGGEIWPGCTQNQITWEHDGLEGSISLYYSVDGGSNWIFEGSYYSGSGTSLSWTVPTLGSDKVRVKVVDYNNSAVYGTSDADFSITHGTDYPTLLSPNGEENLSSGTLQEISWNTTGTLPNISLRYSTNAGATWEYVRNNEGLIANNIANTGSFLWLVPANLNSSQCMIKISYSTSCRLDYSDELFTINNDPALTLTAPLPGETWYFGQSKNILWTASNLPGNRFTLAYSLSDGKWDTITTNRSGSGHTWIVPAEASDNALLRISLDGYPSIADTIDAAFAIKTPAIKVTSPNTGNENWLVGENKSITWTSAGLRGTALVKIEYSADRGESWSEITGSVANSGSYIWTIPNISTSSQSLVKITSLDYPSSKDSSDYAFTITKPILGVTVPNDGQIWYIGESKSIQWSGMATSENVKIELSADSGQTYSVIVASAPNNGEYFWSIPYTTQPSDDCFIRISDLLDPGNTDSSDIAFTIAKPSVTLTQPNSGEAIYLGETYIVAWNNTGMSNSNIKIEYSADSGSTWSQIALVTNTGSYNWAITSSILPSEKAFIKISDENDLSIKDSSDVPFKVIKPSLEILNPNGGEIIYLGQNRLITWKKDGAFSPYVRIEYSADSGATWNVVIASEVNNGSYIWTVGSSLIPGNDYLLRMRDAVDTTIEDISNAVFTVSRPVVTVTSPNGNEKWYQGEQRYIRWTSGGLASSESMVIEVSSDSAATWINLTSTAPNNGTFVWNIPAGQQPGNRYLVKVSHSEDLSVKDSSNQVFEILQPSITVVSPNGGEKWYQGQLKQIRWTSKALVSTEQVSIEYSPDSGATWTVIAASAYNTGSFDWLVPADLLTQQALIRITSLSFPMASDTVDSQFAIFAPRAGDTFATTLAIDTIPFYITDTTSYFSDQFTGSGNQASGDVFYSLLIPQLSDSVSFSVNANYPAMVHILSGESMVIQSSAAGYNYRFGNGDLQPGQTYYLVVEGKNAASGIFRINLYNHLPPVDLYVHNLVSGETEIAPLDTVSFSWNISNIGYAPSEVNWTERIYIQSFAGENRSLVRQTIYTENNELAIGEIIPRSAEVIMPAEMNIGDSAVFVVEVIPGAGILEGPAGTANNTTVEGSAWAVKKDLKLNLSSFELTEGSSQDIAVKVSRTGSVAEALDVNVQLNNPDKFVYPATVTIPAGQAGVTFTISAPDNEIVEGSLKDTVVISAAGFGPVKSGFVLLDNDKATLLISGLPGETLEGVSISFTVSTNLAPVKPLEVFLTSDKQARFPVPASVIIPAGSLSADVTVNLAQDETPEIDVTANLIAAASNHHAANAAIRVKDDDVPGLELIVETSVVSESGGPFATRGVLRRTNLENPIAFTANLSADIPGTLIFPTSISLAEGENEKMFNIGVTDNSMVDGERNIVLTASVLVSSCGCKAPATSSGSFSATITVNDNDGPTLTITAASLILPEGMANAGSIRISRNTSTIDSLTVNLASSDLNEAIVPVSVVIPAGKLYIDVPVTTVNDGVTDGNKQVYFQATAPDFSTGSVWVIITDQNKPDLHIPSVTVNSSTVQAMSIFSYRFFIKNSGFATAPTGVVVQGYLSKDNIIDGSDLLIADDTLADAILVGDSVQMQNAIQAPDKPGIYKLLFIVNPEADMEELLSTNNTSGSLQFEIKPDYTATAVVDSSFFVKGIPVPVTGSAVRFNGEVASEKPVEVYVITEGLRRTVTAMTDASGNYSTEFIPLANEAGYYTVGASFPGMGATAEQDNFNILGIKINNGALPEWRVTLGDTLKGTLSIRNLSNRTLTNFTMAAVDLPQGAQVWFDTIPVFTGYSVINLSYSVVDSVLTPGTNFEAATLKAVSDEGNIQNAELFYFCQAPKAYLVSNISRLNVTASQSAGERLVEIRLFNKGMGETGDIQVRLPQLNWLKSVTPTVLPTVASGDTTIIILKFLALEEVPFNYPVKGSIAIVSQNGNSLSIPFTFEKVSEADGTVKVSVNNQFTYYSEGAPKVADALVKIKNYFTGALYAEGYTDSTGVYIAAGIPEGRHRITVEKEKHLTYNNTVTINPGDTTEATVFLNYQAITFDWSVVPTAVEDEYTIELETKFETHVPVPVVIIEMPDTMPKLYGSEVFAFNVTLTNHGLITAKDVALTMPDNHPEYEFVTNYGQADLLPQQSIQVPVIMQRREQPLEASAPLSMESVSKFLGMETEENTILSSHGSPCIYFSSVVYWYKCDFETGLWQRMGVLFTFEGEICKSESDSDSEVTLNIPDNMWYPKCASCPKIELNPGGSAPEYELEWASCVECLLGIGKALGACSGNKLLSETIKYAASAWCLKETYDRDSISISLLQCNPWKKKKKKKKKIACTKSIIKASLTCAATEVGPPAAGANDSPSVLALSAESDQGDIYKQTADNLQIVVDFYETSERWGLEYFGDMLLSDGFDDLLLLLEPYLLALDSIPAAAQSAILVQMEGYEIPASAIEAFFIRWNTSIDAFNNGVLQPNTDYPGIINWVDVQAYSDSMEVMNNKAIDLGFISIDEMWEKNIATLEQIVEEQSDAVCASVKVKFSQKLTMTREAFEGTLEIFNGHPTDAMDSLTVNISIKDANGVPSNGLFETQTKSLTNLSDVTGTGAIGAEQTGIVKFLFIPEHAAAPVLPTLYSFGGSVTYWDPYAQAMVTLPLSDVTLTVNPSPDLMLHYFMQRNILGDDPYTSPKIEPSVPAELAVLVDNYGYGPAVNMTISSAQPEIVENEKDLAIDFNLIGSNFQGQPKNLGVTDINFGTIPALQARIGQWYFTSSLLGKFVSYDAKVVHANSFGNPDLSLVKGIKLHELTKSIRAYGQAEDGINDFLVNDIFDSEDNPDVIYYSQGKKTARVYPAESGSFSAAVSPPSFTNTLTVAPSDTGWNYIKLPDPGNGSYELVSITRNDGQPIPLDNGWLTFVTLPVSRKPVYENKFHFVDTLPSLEAVNYTVVWKPKDMNVPEIVSIGGVPEEATSTQVETLTVVFSKSMDPTSFTYEDLTLTLQGGENIMNSSVLITQLDSVTFELDLSDLTTGNGFYNLTVQAAGIQDIYGISGESGRQATWSQFLTVPTVQAFLGLPEGNLASSFDTIQVLFNLPVEVSTVIPERFIILKDGQTLNQLVTIDSVRSDHKLFYLSGLDQILTESGTYEFVVDLPEILSQEQVAGIQPQSVSLTVDNEGPVVLNLERSNRGGLDLQHITFIDMEFNEEVKGFNIASLKLTRDGEVIHLPIDMLSYSDLKNWTAGNFGMMTYPEGQYTFTVMPAGFADAIGNTGGEPVEISWTVDRSAVLTISDLRISPDKGYSDSDGISSGLSVNVLFTLAENASQVIISQVDLSGETELTTLSDVTAGEVSVPVTLVSSGNTAIKVSAVGEFGGVGEAQKQLFIDVKPLSAKWSLNEGLVLSRQTDTAPIAFSSRLLNEAVLADAISFRKNGVQISTGGLSVVPVNDTVYYVFGLRAEGSSKGDYQLEVNLASLSKYNSGLAGNGKASVSWKVSPPNNAPLAYAGVDIIVRETGVVTLDGTASQDPDSDPVSYEWVGPEEIDLSDAFTATPSFTVSALQQGKTFAFMVIVSDGSVISTDVVNVVVDLYGHVYYRDADNDGFGSLTQAIASDSRPDGYVDVTGDCDDNNFEINPGAIDILDGLDNDCDNEIDEDVVTNNQNTGLNSAALELSVYPVPSSEHFNVFLKGPGGTDKIRLRVYNELGVLIEETEDAPSGQIFTLGKQYAKGFYVIEAVQGNLRKMMKIIKL